MTFTILSIQTVHKTGLSDVDTHGLLGKLIKFMYSLASDMPSNTGKCRKMLKACFRKEEINCFGSIIVREYLRYELPIWRPFIYAFCYYDIICNYLMSRSVWYNSSYYNMGRFLDGLVGRIRENRDKRTLRILCQLTLPEVVIIHILTYLFKHVNVSSNGFLTF
jgi:hypothetical protein